MTQAILIGGPDGLPAELRRQEPPPGLDKIKIPYCGGHEHFERQPGTDETVVVYQWTGRTRVAE